jgi:hypothetical protein
MGEGMSAEQIAEEETKRKAGSSSGLMSLPLR